VWGAFAPIFKTHNIFPGEVENFCLFSEGRRLRGHEFKVAKESFKTTTRQHFLTNRAFGNWKFDCQC
jgi:hypothetical protein